MKNYRVLKEYDKFYLCESEKGYMECFNKFDYHPDDKGIITLQQTEQVCESLKAHKPLNTPFNYKFEI